MKFFIICLLTCAFYLRSFPSAAQSVAINTDGTVPNTSAILDIKSTNKGLLTPRMTTAQRTSITTPAQGLLVYDTDANSFWFYNGTSWSNLFASLPGGWQLTGNGGTNPSANFFGTTDNQPLRWRVNNIMAGEINPSSFNLFMGFRAGENVAVLGHNNTGIGAFSLNKITGGGSNTGVGWGSLYSTTIGTQNTAAGMEALYSNIEGMNNTAFGYQSLTANITSYNAAFGTTALGSNTTGSVNTAMGESALRFNTTASSNTAVGRGALLTQSYNNGGVQWASNNVAVGAEALFSNQPTSTANGVSNTAVGTAAMRFNTIGFDNTAVGTAALYSNISGWENTAIGRQALFYNNQGASNTATGYKALRENTSGNSNAANGYRSLELNTTGSNNTATGGYSLNSNTTGFKNTASGVFALSSNTTGDYNTAMGNDALANSVTGNNNTAVGNSALLNLTGGFQNIAIGWNSGTHPAAPNIYNTISIGNDGFLNAFQNQAFIGNLSTAWIGGQVNWATYSDARIKTNTTEDVKGLDFITRLRPVTYNKSFAAITELTGNAETENFAGKYDGEQIRYSGFLAQEVEAAAKQSDYNFSGLHKPKGEFDLYSLSYAEFVVPLVKAVQEQQVIIEKQAQTIDFLKKENEETKMRLEKLEKLLSNQ